MNSKIDSTLINLDWIYMTLSMNKNKKLNDLIPSIYLISIKKKLYFLIIIYYIFNYYELFIPALCQQDELSSFSMAS